MSEPGRTVIGLSPFSTFFCKGRRPAAGRLAEVAAHHLHDRIREGDLLRRIEHVLGGDVGGDHQQRQVADDLRRRRHLDDVAEEQIDLVIGLGDLVPAGFEAERAGLFLEVGELAAGHFVQVDLGGAEAEIGFEGAILGADGLEIERDLADRVGVEAGRPRCVGKGFDDRAEAGLRGQAGHRIDRRIDRVDTGFDGGHHRGGGDSRRVVRMEMDRKLGLVAERRDQLLRRGRLEEPGHVLQPDDVGAGGLELLGERDIVFEAVFGAVRIEDVAGVADRALAELARVAHRVHRDAHVLDPVEAVEDAKEIDAALGRLGDEVADGVVGIVGVADGVRAAQQHLQEDVRHFLADAGETLPRILGEEAHGDVEGRAAPAFEREEAGKGLGIGAGDRDQVVAAHAGREQRLVRVAHGRVGDEDAALATHPAGEGFRPVAIEALLGAVGGRLAEARRRYDQPVPRRRRRGRASRDGR